MVLPTNKIIMNKKDEEQWKEMRILIMQERY